jgi:hypothetical protein
LLIEERLHAESFGHARNSASNQWPFTPKLIAELDTLKKLMKPYASVLLLLNNLT